MTDNYNDLTLDQQLRIMEIERRGGDEIDVQTAIISVLDGRSPDELMRLPLADYAALAAKKRFLDYPFPKGDPKAVRHVGGLHLVPTADVTKMTVAQFVDFQELTKQGEAAIVDLLAAFYVPKGCVYGETDPDRHGYDIDAVKRAIRSLSAPDAVAAYAFFLTSFVKSLKAILFCSTTAAAKVKDPQKRQAILERIQGATQILSSLNGAGSIQS